MNANRTTYVRSQPLHGIAKGEGGANGTLGIVAVCDWQIVLDIRASPMMHRFMPTLTIPLDKWVTSRLATFEATRALGLTDQRLAQVMGVSQPTMTNWAKGKEPMPHVRWLALDLLVWRLIEWLPPRAARPLPPPDDFEDPKYARRIVAARGAAGVWAELSHQEIRETIGDPGPELTKRAEELMWKMMDELAARGMVTDD